MRKIILSTVMLLVVAGGVGSASGAALSHDPSLYGNDWRIEHAGKIPYLVQNGIPAFGRFDSDRPKLVLNTGWEFAPDNGTGKPPDADKWHGAKVPGVWNYPRPELLNYIGIGWYRKTFILPPGWKAFNTYRLNFGGVNMRCRVWLNGKELGGHEGGYTPFAFDASNAKPGRNELLVQVDNRMTYVSVPPLNYDDSRMGWFEYGGIHREVYLEAHEALTLFKVVVQTAPRANNKWGVWATTLFWDRRASPGPDGVDIRAFIADHAVRADDKQKYDLRSTGVFNGPKGIWGITYVGEIENPSLWSPESPVVDYEFNINIRHKDSVGADASETIKVPFGVRKFEARPDGLYLNGKPYYMRGINRHEDDPTDGLAESDWAMKRDIDLLKQLHVNHMRTAHYPNDPRWYDLTDSNGIGITEEIPLYQAGLGNTVWLRDLQRGQRPGKIRLRETAPGQFTNPQLVRNASLALIEMIERDVNHPSILAWSIGNENWTFGKNSRKTYLKLKEIAREFDPDRPVTFALLTVPKFSARMERTADVADFISINEYFGWYFGKTEDLKGYLISIHKRFPNRPMIVSEFGAGAVMDTNRIRARRKGGQGTFHPEDQAQLIAKQWAIIRSLPFMSGAMPWAFADFRCGWFKDEAPLPFFNDKGVLTYQREPKPAFYVLRDIYADIMKHPTTSSR